MLDTAPPREDGKRRGTAAGRWKAIERATENKFFVENCGSVMLCISEKKMLPLIWNCAPAGPPSKLAFEMRDFWGTTKFQFSKALRVGLKR